MAIRFGRGHATGVNASHGQYLRYPLLPVDVDKGITNARLERPMASRFFLNRNVIVAPYQRTAVPNNNWIPTPPQRAAQLHKAGGLQPHAPGPITVQAMQAYSMAAPGLHSRLSGFFASVQDALSGNGATAYYG